jgi:plasmid maintenance system killer protein
MDLLFSDKKLEKECSDDRLLQRRHGAMRAGKIKSRLAVLASAARLSDIGPPYRGPMRCHELKGPRAGQLSVDLDHPYRLILVPEADPLPLRPEGGLDWTQVTSVRIVEIADTHE